MNITKEAFLTRLGYNVTEALLAQLEKVSGNTAEFERIASHIVTLNDTLKAYGSFVVLSNSHDFLKIKNQAKDGFVSETNSIIESWAKKYKVEIEKVEHKETFYIKGYEKG